MLRSLIPSMFHRRLALLLALGAILALPLVGQLARLSIVRAEASREQAQRWLTRRSWVPAPRGRIVDRMGRVLALDRPSYNIAVDYTVITGQWADEMARRSARRAAGHRWLDLSPMEREERVARRAAAFRVHLDSAWDALAREAGVSRHDVLDPRRDAVIAEVEGRAARVVAARVAEDLAEREGRGVPTSPKDLEAIQRRAARPIAEQLRPHVLVRRVTDPTGFACMRLATEDVEIPMPSDDHLSPDRTERVERVPGLVVLDTGDREYPLESSTVEIDRSTLPGPLAASGPLSIPVDGLACHVLGTVRDRVYGDERDPKTGAITAPGDAERRRRHLDAHPDDRARAIVEGFGRGGIDRGEYHDGDRIGASGLERSQEHSLRGLRGVDVRDLDSGAHTSLTPDPGRDVRLSLDIALQARIQGAMSPLAGLCVVQPWHKQVSPTQPVGSVLYGAVVVLEVDSGEVLALVSTPTFTRRQLREAPETVLANAPELAAAQPLVNKAVAKIYQPGSIVKALLVPEAVKHGVLSPGQRISCTGHLLEGQPDRLRCWVFKQFGTTHDEIFGHEPNAVEAVQQSCNIFFYTIGRRLGARGITEAFGDFLVGQRYDLGLGNEAPGTIGDLRALRAGKPGVAISDAIQMGMGQGPVAWTPLHAADAYATLARGGVRVAPTLIAGERHAEPVDLGLDPSAVHDAVEGLRLAVNDDRGTGHHLTLDHGREPIFNAPGVKIWGKTGTAQASPIYFDPDGKGPDPAELVEEGDHSWFVILAGRDRPEYAIAVVVDFGGSGGKVSGPLANQVVHALIAEGYLAPHPREKAREPADPS